MDEVRTERLVATRPLLRDADELRPMLPAWERSASGLLVREMDHWKRHRFGRWIWREERRMVGLVGLLAVEEGVELAWFVDPACWGRGYATEAAGAAVAFAFGALGLDTLTAKTRPDNARSLAVIARLGMVYERDLVHAGHSHQLFRLTNSMS